MSADTVVFFEPLNRPITELSQRKLFTAFYHMQSASSTFFGPVGLLSRGIFLKFLRLIRVSKLCAPVSDKRTQEQLRLISINPCHSSRYAIREVELPGFFRKSPSPGHTGPEPVLCRCGRYFYLPSCIKTRLHREKC